MCCTHFKTHCPRALCIRTLHANARRVVGVLLELVPFSTVRCVVEAERRGSQLSNGCIIWTALWGCRLSKAKEVLHSVSDHWIMFKPASEGYSRERMTERRHVMTVYERICNTLFPVSICWFKVIQWISHSLLRNRILLPSRLLKMFL